VQWLRAVLTWLFVGIAKKKEDCKAIEAVEGITFDCERLVQPNR
jgi:hypothetical protein